MDWMKHDNKNKLGQSGIDLTPDEISSMKADAMRRVQHMREQAKNTLNYVNYPSYFHLEGDSEKAIKTARKALPSNDTQEDIHSEINFDNNTNNNSKNVFASDRDISIVLPLLLAILSEGNNRPLAAALLYLL